MVNLELAQRQNSECCFGRLVGKITEGNQALSLGNLKCFNWHENWEFYSTLADQLQYWNFLKKVYRRIFVWSLFSWK